MFMIMFIFVLFICIYIKYIIKIKIIFYEIENKVVVFFIDSISLIL